MRKEEVREHVEMQRGKGGRTCRREREKGSATCCVYKRLAAAEWHRFCHPALPHESQEGNPRWSCATTRTTWRGNDHLYITEPLTAASQEGNHHPRGSVSGSQPTTWCTFGVNMLMQLLVRCTKREVWSDKFEVTGSFTASGARNYTFFFFCQEF